MNKTPLEIAFYNPSVSCEVAGGVETFIREIALRISANKNNVNIVSGRASIIPEMHFLVEHGVKLHLLPFFRRFSLQNKILIKLFEKSRHEVTPFAIESFTMIPSSIFHFVRNKYDLVSTCLPNDCLVKLWLKEIPFVIHFQGGVFNRQYIRFLNTYPDVHIIPCSQYMERELKTFKINGIRPYVHNGVDTSLFYPRKSLGNSVRKRLGISENNVILYVGRFTTEKGVSHLIQALPKICSNHPNTVVILIGSGPLLKYYHKLAVRLGIRSQVKIVENIPHSELPFYYNAADIFVLPSYREPFGIVLTEAMACELPIVASNKGGIPEIVKSGKSGILVPIKDSKSIASAIISLLADKDLREKMGKNGRERVLKDFTWDIAAKKIFAQYIDIVKRA